MQSFWAHGNRRAWACFGVPSRRGMPTRADQAIPKRPDHLRLVRAWHPTTRVRERRAGRPDDPGPRGTRVDRFEAAKITVTSAAFGNNKAIPSGFTCDGWRVSLGIHMAGPDLTPKTFRDGMFAYPRSGGRACGCITTVQGLLWQERRTARFRRLLRPGRRRPGVVGGGSQRSRRTGRHHREGLVPLRRWSEAPSLRPRPKAEPKWFDTNGTITGADVTTLPASDQPPNYPCEGCPSAAG
jgi:hypothetical protein